MKKILLPIVTMLLCMTACKKEENGILRLEVEHYNSEAKMHIDDEHYAVWDEGDFIYLNGTPSIIQIQGNKAIVNDVTEGAPYYASYPYPMTPNNSNYTMTLPAVQNYRENANGEQIVAAPMAAYSTDGSSLKFRNLGSVMAVKVENNTGSTLNVYRIEVSSIDNTPLCGLVTLSDINNGSLIIGGGSSNTTVALECGGINIPSDGKIFYIALPVLTNAKLSVKVYTEDKCYTRIQGSSSASFDRNTIHEVPFSAASEIATSYLRAVCGVFSVSATKTVSFAAGNLHCDASGSTHRWWFAKHQYTTTKRNQYYSSDVEHFFWGYQDFGETRQPNGSNNGEITFNWGEVFGDNTWYTLTGEEWDYVANTRATSVMFNDNSTPVANARYILAKIDTTGSETYIKGMILFPDNANIDIATPSNINLVYDYLTNYYPETYTLAQWAKFEAQGCVFLPAAGQRGNYNESANNVFHEVGTFGLYWSSNTVNGTDRSNGINRFEFGPSFYPPTLGNSDYVAHSVRLVKVLSY